MTLDRNEFKNWIAAICEQHGRTFSPLTFATYYQQISTKLDTEAFVRAAAALFYEGGKFPAPSDFVQSAKDTHPVNPYQLPAHTPPAWDELTPAEQEERRDRFAQIRAQLQTVQTLSGFARVKPIVPLEQEIAQKTAWPADPVLKSAAIEWAMNHDAIEVVTDETGSIAGFRSKEVA